MPNTNDPVGSVGPNVPESGDPSAQAGAAAGFGASHVLYPAHDAPIQAQAWAGWPIGWDVPSSWTNHSPRYAGGGSDIVFAAIDRNATAWADLPVVVSKGLARQPAPTWLANPQPEQYSSWIEFARQVWWSYQACGEAFLIVTSRFQDSGKPRTFMLLDPWLVNAEIQDGIRRYTINGQDATSEILHIRYTSWPGDARGHGPLEVAGDRVLASQVLMRYASDLAANGGIPWAVIKTKYRLTSTQITDLRTQWLMAARSRSGAPAILDGETELVPLQTTPKDMALSDLQTAAESRIAVLLGVPPYILGLPSAEGSSTPYQNVTNLFDYWVRQTLHPHGTFILRAISAWALPWLTELLLDASSFVQPGPFERAQYYQVMAAVGAMSVDEIRAAERLPPLGGDAALPRVEQGVVTDASGL